MSEFIFNPNGPDIVLIQEEPDGICSDCKKTDEVRPYGKDGALVCFTCAMKDEIETTMQMERRLFGNINCTREEAEELIRNKAKKVQ